MSNYCTYLTIYQGNKLPPFYVGYSTFEKIQRGYHGSVQSKQYKNIWKEELKINPHLFKTVILTKHINAKEANLKEIYFQKCLSVIRNPLYINKAIGLYCDPKTRKHGPMFGRKHSEETKAKMRISNSERIPWNKKEKKPKQPHGNIGNNYGIKNKGRKRPDLSERNRIRFRNV